MKIQTIPAEDIAKLPAIEATGADCERLWREDIKGCIASVHVDLLNHQAIITTVTGCTDMTGAIATVMMLDPDIESVQIIDGNAFTGTSQKKDSQYVRDPEAGWYSIRWHRPAVTRTENFGTAFVVKRLQQLLLAALRATRRMAKIERPDRKKSAPPFSGRTGRTEMRVTPKT
jgi:hypothetical protein